MYTLCITQETSRTRCHHTSHPALHSSILFDDCLRVWYWPNKCLRRLRICVISDPLLYAGSCDVNGGRGCVHVSEADHCLCPNLHQVLCCCITYMLVWVYNSMRLTLGGIRFSVSVGGKLWEVRKCADVWSQVHFPPPLPAVVPFIPVVIPMAVDLSDAVSRDLVVRRPTEENGRGL